MIITFPLNTRHCTSFRHNVRQPNRSVSPLPGPRPIKFVERNQSYADQRRIDASYTLGIFTMKGGVNCPFGTATSPLHSMLTWPSRTDVSHLSSWKCRLFKTSNAIIGQKGSHSALKKCVYPPHSLHCELRHLIKSENAQAKSKRDMLFIFRNISNVLPTSC